MELADELQMNLSLQVLIGERARHYQGCTNSRFNSRFAIRIYRSTSTYVYGHM